MTKSKKPLDFEAALAELEKLVDKMEAGEAPLEDSLRDFERGIELTRTCQQALEAAEQKVQILLQQDSEAEPQDFDNEA